MGARRHVQCRYHARTRPLLGGTPPGIGLRLRSGLLHDRGGEGRDGSVSDPSDQCDPANFTSRWGGCCRPCAGCCRLATPTRAVAVTQRIALLFALVSATSPGWAAGSCALVLGLLAFSCAADIVIFSVDPAESVR